MAPPAVDAPILRSGESLDFDEGIPPLENGDRLDRAEFERRYEAMPPGIKAELLEGVVYMASPVSQRKHGKPHFLLNTWLYNYMCETPGLDAGTDSTVRFDADDQPQPDCHMRILPECGGQADLDDDAGYLTAAPEFVAEVSSSTVSYDLGVKLRVYQRRGVREYLVWRVRDRAIDWFELRADACDRITTTDGILRSRLFPGLWLDTDAAVRMELKRVRQVGDLGVASPEHAAFVAELERRSRSAEGSK